MSLFAKSTRDWIDRFEAEWQKAPYPSLRKWLMPCCDSAQIEQAAELCAIDLEWCWRVNADSNSSAKKMSRKDFPRTPVAEDYRSYLGELWNTVELRQRLVVVEWGVRNLWGDKPDTDSFQSRFPDLGGLHHQMETHLDSLLPMDVSILQSGNLTMQMQVPSRFIIGRQRKDEPPAPAWLKPTSRLLIASNEERQISRAQVQVRRTRKGEIEIANADGAYAIALDLSTLEPNQIARFSLPIELRFGDILTSIGEAFDARYA